MTDFYIDANRGNNANSGLTKNAAWASLEAVRTKLLTGTVAAGDNFLFESSSLFLPSRYLRIGSGFEPITYINGTAGSRITFDKYDFSSQYSGKPEFRMNKTPSVNDWVWDSGKGLWYWPYPQAYETNNLTWGFYPRVTIDGQLCQVVKFESASFVRGNDPSAYLEVGVWQVSTPGRLYMWTPNATSNPATNPTSVYGAGAIVAEGTGQAVFQFNRCGSYVSIKNLLQRESGALVQIYNDSSGSGDILSFTVDGCEAYDCGTLAPVNLVDSTKNADGFSLLNSRGERLVGGAFIGHTKNLLIKGNYIDGCNLARSDGGAFYVSGSYAGYGGVVEDNYITDARYETGGCFADGCGIYLEAGTIGVTVRRNEVCNSPLALQDNTGKTTSLWHSNYVHDCDKGMTITDQSNNATVSSLVKAYNNTFQNIRMNALYPTMPSARFGAVIMRKGTPAAANYSYDLRNNVILGAGSTSSGSGYGILQEPGTNLTALNNAISGFFGVRADEYTFANVSTPATTITAAPTLDAKGAPALGSPCLGAGNKHGLVISDKNNTLFKTSANEAPAVGCFERAPFNLFKYIGW